MPGMAQTPLAHRSIDMPANPVSRASHHGPDNAVTGQDAVEAAAHARLPTTRGLSGRVGSALRSWGHASGLGAAPSRSSAQAAPPAAAAALPSLAMTIGTRQETRAAYATLRTIPRATRAELAWELTHNGLSHTLFGNKPATMLGGERLTQQMDRLMSGHSLNPNFVFVKSPAGRSFLLNLDNVRKVVDDAPLAFGLRHAPSQADVDRKVAELCTPDGLARAQRDHVALGTLLGFGESNARRFNDLHATGHMANAEWHTEGPHSSTKYEEDKTFLATLMADDALKGPVHPFGMRPWDGHESALIANDNVGTALTVNEEVRAMREQARQGVVWPREKDMLLIKALDALFGQSSPPPQGDPPVGHTHPLLKA
jgi:hypothetical protein